MDKHKEQLKMISERTKDEAGYKQFSEESHLKYSQNKKNIHMIAQASKWTLSYGVDKQHEIERNN